MEKQMMGQETERELEIDLRELFWAVMKRWWLVIMGGLLGVLIAGVYTFQIATPIYQASSAIYMRGAGNTVASLQDLQIGAELTNDYEEIFKSRPILEKVVERLGLNMSYKALANKIQLSNPSDTRILRITVNDPDPVEATNIVNTLVEVGMDSVKEIDAKEPYLIEEAVVDWDAISPSVGKNLMLGGLLGALVIVAIVAIRCVANDRIRTVEELESVLQGPVLASLPESNAYNYERGKKKRASKRRAA